MSMKNDVALLRQKAGRVSSMGELLGDVEAIFRNNAPELAGEKVSCRFVVSDLGQSFAGKLEYGVYTPLSANAPADVIITAKNKDFLGLLSGSLNPVKAMLFGKIKIQGDIRALDFFAQFL